MDALWYTEVHIQKRDYALERACVFEEKARLNPSIASYYEAKMEKCLKVAEIYERKIIKALAE